MTAVDVRELSFGYDEGKRILDEVSFTVSEGETLVLAGLSGCGKTTLCYALCGIIPNSIQGEFSGSVEVFGENISQRPLADTARTVGLVFQNPDDQLVCTTVEDELAFGLENLCVEPEIIRRRVDESLRFFGLGELAQKNPSRLSGGQKKLVTIASALIPEPKAIILDEPMTGLDERARAIVDEAILSLKKEGKTLITVEHDLSLAGYADRILYLRDGKLYDKP